MFVSILRVQKDESGWIDGRRSRCLECIRNEEHMAECCISPSLRESKSSVNLLATDVVPVNIIKKAQGSWENLNRSVLLYRFKVCLCYFRALQESSLMHLLNSSEPPTPSVCLLLSLHSADEMHIAVISAWFSLT